MPSFCAVVGCGSRAGRDKRSFFRFPSVLKRGGDKIIQLSKERRDKWIKALRRNDLTESKIKFGRICDKHFIMGCPADILDSLSPDWIPSVHMGYATKGVAAMDRHIRRKRRAEASTSTAIECGIPTDNEDNNASLSVDIPQSDLVEVDASVRNEFESQGNEKQGISIQTDITMDFIYKMEDVINQQTEEIVKLKDQLNCYNLTEESFRDDTKTKFYTGLENFTVLMLLFNLISKDLSESPRSSLTKFQQLILTLQRLRLNLSLCDLAYRYGISLSTASRVFKNCLYILYTKLEGFIIWPERDVLRKTMPSVFLNTFGNRISVILDCFEIKMERPSNSLSSAQVGSSYKHHHTAKFLIGICPQGVITFISKGYGGRSSDKEVALQSGILEKLLPGDIVLSDRGFLITDEVGLYCAEIKMPCFTKGITQLSPYQVEKNREISHLRNHVERVIGSLRQNLKKFHILHSVVPITLVKTQPSEDALPSLINQIVTVCCALLNLCPTVVPLS